MVRNNASGAGTRHVNVRYHFIRELHGNPIILYHRPSEDNEADMMTKNPTKEEFNRHSPKLISKVLSHLILKHKKGEEC